MSDLRVRMTLTLADAASGPLRAFTQILEQLKIASAGISKQLDGVTASIAGINRVAAASGVASFTAGLNGMRAAATTAAGGTTVLEQALTGLNGTMARLGTQVTAATAGMTRLTGAQNAAAAAAQAHNAPMQQAGGNMAATNAHAGSLASTLTGLAKLWGAMKIEGFLKKSVSEASEFQNAEVMLKGLNLGAVRTKEIMDQAWSDSKALKFVSVLDTIEARMAAIGGLAVTMDDKVINATLPQAMKLANNLSVLGDKTPMKDMVRNVYGLFEARGQTEDIQAMLRTMDVVQKSFVTTGGKVVAKDIEQFLRQYGQGATQISDTGILNIVGVIDQMKIAGGGGGGAGGGAERAATAFKMLQAYGLGKPMNKQGAAMWREAGMFGDIGPDNGSGTSRNMKAGSIVDSKVLAEDPIEWVGKQMPRILAYTQRYAKQFYPDGDMRDPKAVAIAIQKFFTATGVSVTAAAALGMAGQPSTGARIAEQTEVAKNAKGVDAVAKDVGETWAQKVKEANKAFTNLHVIIGTQLLPVLTPLIEKFGEFLRGISEFTSAHPSLTFWNALALGIGTVVLAVSGFKALFGITGSILGMFVGLGPAAAVGTAAAGGALLTFVKDVGSGFLKVIAFLARILISFDIGFLIGEMVRRWISESFPDFTKGLDKFITYAIGWGDRLVTSIENAWTRAKVFFGLISKAQGDADVKQNSASLAARLDANAPTEPKHKANGVVTESVRGSFRPSDNYGERSPAKPSSKADQLLSRYLGDAEDVDLNDPEAKKKKKGRKGSGASRFANYDAELDEAKNAYRLEEAETKRHLQTMAKEYQAGMVSVDSYYADKLAVLQRSVAAEIAILEREKAAYAKQGDKQGANRAQNEIDIKRVGLSESTEQIAIEKKQAIAKLDQDALKLQQDLLRTSGQRRAAELQRIYDEEKARTDLLVLNQKETGVSREQADAYLARIKAAGDLKVLEVEQQVRQEARKVQLIAIEAAERNGTITELDASRQKIALRKLEAAAANDLLVKELALAKEAGNDVRAAQINTALAQNNATLGELPPQMTAVLKSAEQGFTNFFSSVMSGTKSFKQAFKDLGQSIFQTINDLVAKDLGSALFKSLFGGSGGPAGGGAGSMLSSLFGGGSAGGAAGGGSILGSLFGGSGGGGFLSSLFGAGSSAGASSAASMFAAGIMPLAVGTDYVPRDMLAMIHEGERVMPASDNAAFTAAARMGGDGPAVTGGIHIYTTGPVDRRTIDQARRELGEEVRRASRLT